MAAADGIHLRLERDVVFRDSPDPFRPSVFVGHADRAKLQALPEQNQSVFPTNDIGDFAQNLIQTMVRRLGQKSPGFFAIRFSGIFDDLDHIREFMIANVPAGATRFSD